MLFTPTRKTTGMNMSVNKIHLPYQKVVDFLGEPHLTNEGNQRSKVLGYKTEAKWIFRFFDIPFEIKYDSSDWLMNKRMEEIWGGEYSGGKVKIPPLEKTTYGEIIGDSNFVKTIIIPIILQSSGKSVSNILLYGIIDDIFDNQMERYK